MKLQNVLRKTYIMDIKDSYDKIPSDTFVSRYPIEVQRIVLAESKLYRTTNYIPTIEVPI